MKNHWKILGVLLGILVFFNSCQDDTEGLIPETAVNQEGHTHFDTVNGHEIPHIIDFLKSKSNDKMQFTLTDDVSPVGTNRNHEEDLTVTTPLLDQIKQATNSFGKSNYTFKLIEEETRESTYFLNLVVKEYGGLLYMYILKYVPTEGWLNTYTGDQDLSSFDGVIYLYADDGKYLATMDMSQGVSTSSQGRSSDCPDPNTDNGSSDGPGDGTTGPGDGTSTTNGDGSGGLEIGIGAEFGWRCNWRNMIHPNPDVCNNTEAGGEWVLIIIDSAHRSMANRTVCPPPDENCQIDCVGNVDPVTCTCVEEDEEVEGTDIPVIIDISDIALVANLNEYLEPDLTDEQIDWIFENEENREFAEYALEILKANPDANPLLGADCRSFEYAQPPGALQKGCAVTDFNHTFYTAGIRSNGSPYYGEIDSDIDIIYFTMPTFLTNGQAANLTAEAVTNAIQATDLHFFVDPDISQFDLGDFFRDALISQMTILGGSVSTSVEPFPIPSPAPYLTSLFGASTDCN